MKNQSFNEVKDLALSAAANGYQLLPILTTEKNGKLVPKQIFESGDYIPHDEPITVELVTKYWVKYEGLVGDAMNKYKNQSPVWSMTSLKCGQAIKCGDGIYYLLGIDLDFDEQDKIDQIIKTIKLQGGYGKMITKRGSKGLTIFVKVKQGFATYNKKTNGNCPVDWLIKVRSTEGGHTDCFTPPGINLKTRKPYEWLTKETIFNTKASDLITIDNSHYYEIAGILENPNVMKRYYAMKGEGLAARIAKISKYGTSTANKPGDFEDNWLTGDNNAMFFGLVSKIADVGCPTKLELVKCYKRQWQLAYLRDGKQWEGSDADMKSEDTMVNHIKETNAVPKEEQITVVGEVEIYSSASPDTKEALNFIGVTGMDNLIIAGGGLRVYEPERGYWRPVRIGPLRNMIIHRAQCGLRCAEQAISIIESMVSENEHSVAFAEMMETGSRDQLSKIAFRNTTVTITDKGIEQGESKKEDYLLYGFDLEYDPNAKCELIDKEYNRVFEPNAEILENDTKESKKSVKERTKQNVKIVQQYLAYSLVPYNRMVKSLFIHGATQTGKSTLLELHVQFMKGYGDSELCCEDLNIKEFKEPEKLSKINGKFFAYCGDDDGTPTTDDIKIWKKMTGGEMITTRQLYHNPLVFRPITKYAHCSNSQVKWKTTNSDAIYERLINIEATNKTLPEEKRKNHYVKVLMAKEELTGYAARMVQSLADLYKEGRFVLTQWQKAHAKEAVGENNIVGDWLEMKIKTEQFQIVKEGAVPYTKWFTLDSVAKQFLEHLVKSDEHRNTVKFWEGQTNKVKNKADQWLKDNGHCTSLRKTRRLEGKTTPRRIIILPIIHKEGNF